MAQAASKQAPAAASARKRAAPAGGRRAGTSRASAPAALAATHGNQAVSALLGGGTALPPEVLAEMESRFGQSFSNVRVHNDPQAHASAAALGAKAYTHGNDIVFSANRFTPHAGTGKRLLAHELAHVVQQRRGGAAPALDSNAGHEQGADAAANAIAAGQGPVSVAGATGVGIARDEDEGWAAKLRRKYRETKEAIPEEYREKAQKAADFAADKAVVLAAAPLGPVGMYAADGLGSAMLHGAQKTVMGEEGAADDIKNFGRDKVQEGLGAAKGVATQVTEIADTAMWVGNEYGEVRNKAAEKVGGKEGSFGNKATRRVMDTAATVLGMGGLPAMAEASDQAKAAGLVDPDTGQASLTAPMSGKLNQWAKAAEEGLGATPSEPEMFSKMEKAELATAIGSQVALAFTGVEEVKIAMNVVGALSGLRGIVESIRHDKDWKTSPRFWGSIIGMGLSIVGLKHTMAASKITTILLRYGWVAAAIPPLSQMAVDYYYLETHPNIAEDERKQVEARIKQGWVAAVHVIKDAILHVSQTTGGSKAKPPPGDDGAAPPKQLGAPAEKAGGAVVENGGGTVKPAAKTETAAPVVPPAQVGTDAGATVTPIGAGKGKPASQANKTLDQNLAKQSPDKAGTVSRLPVRKAGTPPSEPAQQKVPVALESEGKMAVGQTHGADGPAGTTSKPGLRVVGGNEPATAVLKTPGSKSAPAGPGPAAKGGVTVVPNKKSSGGSGASAPVKGPAKDPGKPTSTGGKTAPSKAGAKADGPGTGKAAAPLVPVNAKGGRGTNAEPLVAVRVQGGGSKRKGTYFVEGSPEFAAAAKDKRFVVMPESSAKDLKFRPAGVPFDQTITPLKINGVQVESNGAGGGKGNKHNVSARADIQPTEEGNKATYGKTIGASVAEAHGHKTLLQNGEVGIIRPGNASTGGVDSITADTGGAGKPGGAGKAGGAGDAAGPKPPKVFLNDFTGPKTSKGSKSTHDNWVLELRDAVVDPNFGFGNKQFNGAVYDAIASGEVYVRPIRVENTSQGTKVTHLPPIKVKVPPAVQAAVAKARADRGE